MDSQHGYQARGAVREVILFLIEIPPKKTKHFLGNGNVIHASSKCVLRRFVPPGLPSSGSVRNNFFFFCSGLPGSSTASITERTTACEVSDFRTKAVGLAPTTRRSRPPPQSPSPTDKSLSCRYIVSLSLYPKFGLQTGTYWIRSHVRLEEACGWSGTSERQRTRTKSTSVSSQATAARPNDASF